MTAPESRDAQGGVEAVLADVIDELLAARLQLGTSSRYVTDFGDNPGRLADGLATALGPVIAAARAEALRSAAEQCDRDAEDGHCGSPVCAENNRITARWLRDRADRKQAGHQDAQDGPGATSRGEAGGNASGALEGAQRLTGNDDDTEDQ